MTAAPRILLDEAFLSKRSRLERWALELARLTDEEIREALAGIPLAAKVSALFDPAFVLRPQQQLPPGNWRIWLVKSGRGWGKNFTLGHAVRSWEKGGEAGRIALVGATAADVRDVLVSGETGILAAYPRHERPRYVRSQRRVDFDKTSGAKAFLYSAAEPDRLRGPQHHKVVADEIAAWANPEAMWSQIKFGLRLGSRPQAILTTTPRPIALIRQLIADAQDPTSGVVVTSGSTFDNALALPDDFLAEMVRAFGGTRLGQQELEGEVLDLVGGLFRPEWFRFASERPAKMSRIVVSIDPAITARNDETGILVVGRSGENAYVLADLSGVMSPDQWARRALEAAMQHKASIVVETNRGGDLVKATIRSVGRAAGAALAKYAQDVAIREVRATTAKDTRAEPVAALYEQGRVFHVGRFAKLEQQMCEWAPTSQEAQRARRQATSPDRMDALVWGITDLGFHMRVWDPWHALRKPVGPILPTTTY